jgi:Zn-dependent protease
VCGWQLNLYLMVFNLLLPAYPLDGGRIFADLLILCGVPIRTAAIITVAVAVVFAGGLIAWGIVEVAILTVAVSPTPS